MGHGFLGFLMLLSLDHPLTPSPLVQMAMADSRLTRVRTVDCDYDPLVGSQSYEFACTHPQRFRWRRRWLGWNTKIHHTLVQQRKAHIHPTSHQWCTLVQCSLILSSVMYHSPVFCDLPSYCLSWCTFLPYSMMYHGPVWADVAFSRLPWCTLVLFPLLYHSLVKSLMYLSPIYHVVP